MDYLRCVVERITYQNAGNGFSVVKYRAKGYSDLMTVFGSLFARLARSKFRSSFSLKANDQAYVKEKGMDMIRSHAQDFVRTRLAPAEIPNDGKQTPMKGHPVFLAQHATATCCRGCLEKWHRLPKGCVLTEEQQEYIVGVLMEWIERQMKCGSS